MKALLGVQMCREDPLLSKLVSSCNPIPLKPLRPVVDACVNLAIYSFKDNPALGTLTDCAQQHSCLTGVSQAETDCANATNPQPLGGPELDWKLPPPFDPTQPNPTNRWDVPFQRLAESGKAYTVVKGLNHGWDCFKKQQFTFVYNSNDPSGAYKVVHTLNLTANMGLLKFPYLMTLGGANTATWPDITFKYCPVPETETCRQPGVYTEVLTTAGIKESDPWLVLDVSADSKYALVLMAVNVGPSPNIYLQNQHSLPVPGGIPGGYILVQDGLGLSRAQMAALITKLERVWAGTYGIDFTPWCKLY
jgi:hypothetical protein